MTLASYLTPLYLFRPPQCQDNNEARLHRDPMRAQGEDALATQLRADVACILAITV